jgi:CPA1 family monovalent cation:H+ antiporter
MKGTRENANLSAFGVDRPVNGFEIIAVLITLTALLSYLNHRYIRFPTTIGVMAIALALSLILLWVRYFDPRIEEAVELVLRRIDFDKTLMQGMLSFLLFAGALEINLNDLTEQRDVISVLAVFGVVLSVFSIGTATYFILKVLGLPLDYTYCLLFGAIISPTDPVSVLAILKSAKVPKSLETNIAGESLFNDGIGVVAFLVLYEIAVRGQDVSAGHIGLLFLEEALGGALFGLATGWITYRLLKSVDNYQVEVLLTMALVMGGYSLASALHLSGPIAIVVAGLLIGNHGRRLAMSDRTREHLDTFWELIDEILNAVLFVLIGMEILLLTFTTHILLAGLLAVPAVLTARWVSVRLPIGVMSRWRPFSPGAAMIMTWGGLRGGISVALALSLPSGAERETILALTYTVVVFSVLFQGLTLRPVVLRAMGKKGDAKRPHP